MTQIRKILVPVDFSREAARVVEFAADLSRRYEATLDIVYVLNPPTYALPEGYVVPTAEQFAWMRSDAEERLAQVAKDALDKGAFKVDARVLRGFPASEIMRLAEEERPDLIVMGTHGRTGLQHFLLGSVAQNIVQLAPCPVLTVRTPNAA